jgi:hypothetical protein
MATRKKTSSPKKSAKKTAGKKRSLPVSRTLKKKRASVVLAAKPVRPPGQKIKCKHCNTTFFLLPTQKKKWAKGGFVCPTCNIDMCCFPPTERELQKLQTKFFENGRKPETMGDMYKILKSYAQSIILKKHLYQVDPKDLDYHAHMAAWYLVEHYYNNATFRIRISFGAYLNSTVYQAVYQKPKNDDRVVSIDLENDESRKVYELLSSTDLDKEIQQKTDPALVLNYINKLIVDLGKLTDSEEEDILRLRGIHLYLTSGANAVDKFFNFHNRKGKQAFEETMRILREELHRLHQGD